MKHYTVNLLITCEDNNEQLIQLRAPHLTGKQVHELVALSIEGVAFEPEPPILKVPTSKAKKRFGRKDTPVTPPAGFKGEDLNI